MKTPILTLIALSAGIVLGVAFGAPIHKALVPSAHAQEAPPPAPKPHVYKIVDPSMRMGGYEEDLNKMTASGWHFVSPLPLGNGNSALIFER